MSNAKRQLDALTGARGIAAWYVVFYHIREAFDASVPQGLVDFFAKGYLAVDLFFVLSGFVMWLNYGPKFEAQGLRAAPDFLKRRIARIYPLHFVMLMAMLGFVLLLGATGRGDPARYPMAELPLHFLLAQNWGLTSVLSWNDPAWSISTELGAYLVLSFVALGLVKLPNRAWINVGLVAVLCLAVASLFAADGQDAIGNNITGLGLWRCLTEFFIGTLICRLWQRASRTTDAAAAVVAASTITIWASGLAAEIWTAPALFATIVYGLARSSAWAANPLSSRPLVHLGDISYSTYLAHFFLWIVFKLLFVSDADNVSLPMMALFAGLTCVASELLYRIVEEPGRKWMQGLSLSFMAAKRAT